MDDGINIMKGQEVSVWGLLACEREIQAVPDIDEGAKKADWALVLKIMIEDSLSGEQVPANSDEQIPDRNARFPNGKIAIWLKDEQKMMELMNGREPKWVAAE